METDISPETASSLASKAGWSLVAFGVILGGFGAAGGWATVPFEAVGSPLMIAAGLGAIVLIWRSTQPMTRGLEVGIMALATVTAFLNQLVSILGRSYYTTDSAAFNEAATRIMLKGHNPYQTSLLPYASQLLKDINGYWTYTLGGGHVSTVSYPAGAFLLEAPLHGLGINHLPADVLDLIAGTLALVFLWFVLPRSIRWLAPALLLSFIYLGGFANGGTDALFIPFLMVAVWQWDRFSDHTRNLALRWAGPVALGIACAIKQSPWFVVPFLFIGIGIEARRHQSRVWSSVLGYASATLGTFVALNLPFIIWSPSAWWRGITLPLTKPLVPDGSGFVTLVLHGFLPSARISYLSIAGFVSEIGLLVAFVYWYPTMKRIWLFVLPLVFFIPGRSLSSYLVDFLPVALIAGLSVTRVDAGPGKRWPRIWTWIALGVPTTLAALFIILAFSIPVLSVRTLWAAPGDAGQSIIAVRVALHNETNKTIYPFVMVNTSTPHPSGFWIPAHHQRLVLGPRQTRVVTLYPPTWVWAPGRGQSYSVQVYTKTPASVSSDTPTRWMYGKPPN